MLMVYIDLREIEFYLLEREKRCGRKDEKKDFVCVSCLVVFGILQIHRL